MRTLPEIINAQKLAGTTHITDGERRLLKNELEISGDRASDIFRFFPHLHDELKRELDYEEHDRYIEGLRVELRKELEVSIKSSRAALMKVRKLAADEVYDVEFVDSPVATLLERAELDLYSALAIADRIIK